MSDRHNQTVLRQRLAAIRAHTVALAAPLSAEDACVQSMPDASPVKWHLAHTTWFFETFILEKRKGFAPFNAAFRFVFNSYYQGVGPQHARPQRGLLTRPSLREVHDYRAQVEGKLFALLDEGVLSDEECAVLEVGLHHEQQHQELLLTDIKHLLSLNPLSPVYSPLDMARPPGAKKSSFDPANFVTHKGGLTQIGHAGSAFCYDNETPEHQALVHPHGVATSLVTCGQWRAFMADGGYQNSALWLDEGWHLVQTQGWRAPLYWRGPEQTHGEDYQGAQDGHDANLFTLHGTVAVNNDEPVCHVSFFEAEAFARWAQGRLPGEEEWEIYGRALPMNERALSPVFHHPVAGDGDTQLFGEVWQWTQSPYRPYPGFVPLAGALGEYNGKFMCGPFVLRGSSCATPRGHSRATYRNFFAPASRWQFSGLRLAQDSGIKDG